MELYLCNLSIDISFIDTLKRYLVLAGCRFFEVCFTFLRIGGIIEVRRI